MADPVVGIDLGTTHSLIAVFDDAGPRVLANELGQQLVPSVVAVDDTGHLVVGAPAADLAIRRPQAAASRFKPDMGTQTMRAVGGQKLSPTSLSALVLTELRMVAERALQTPLGPVVITVPAWFREPQRRATLEAGQLAGLDVRHLLNEPTAAALAYGLAREDAEETVVVLDLGGGTFDVTVLELFDGVVDVRASTGDVHLGGEDITDVIVQEALRRSSGVVRLDPEARGSLRHRAEVLKRRLSIDPVATLGLSDSGDSLEVTRAELEAWCAPLMVRLRRCVREAMMQSGVRTSEVTSVLLVGGATRMPMVGALAEDLLGQAPRMADDVDQVVALGAAVQAGLLGRHAALRERVVTDVLTHSLGVGTQKHWGDQVFPDRFDPILQRGTALPASRTSNYFTLHHEQPTVTFKVYEGEHRDAKQNTLLARLTLEDLPLHPDDADAREELVVRFTQDTSGLLEVEATVVSTGASAQVVLERTVRPLSDEARAEAETVLARLRTHPRELLPNRHLVERATRLVSMLTGGVRRELDELLTAFEASLERGEVQLQDALRLRLAFRCDQVAAAYDLDLL